ncbi:MAG: 50S ribosomal protein L9 [Patescibacteria group bacterium]|jgi:large subunit ribosomal protein L9
MKVILKRTVPTLGNAETVCEVSEGYARNFLFPRQLAEVATKQRLDDLATHKKQREGSAAAKQAGLAKVLQRLQGKEFTTSKKSSEQGRLFSALHATDIVALLEKKKFIVPETAVQLLEPIKTVGKHKVTISVPHSGQAVISLSILEER